MNVLSLFDGMSCGRIALERAGLKSDNPVEDLRKAAWYITREISRLEKQNERV